MSSPLDDLHEQNRKVIEEIRRGSAVGSALLVLHTIGARSGQERLNPVMFEGLGESKVVVVASANGAPHHPDWYHNLVANPTVIAEIGTETRRCHARTATGDEREDIWSRFKREYPAFAGFEAMTSRQIPVVILETLGAP
jgi:deazaflavin-dependent oxidoreductase (nitroreductase family)